MKAIIGFTILVLTSTFYVSLGGLLPNGDFEEGPSPRKLSGTKVEGPNAIPKWVANGFVEYITKDTQQGDMVLVVPEGKHAVRLGNGASIRQKVEAAKGKFYALTFSFARTCSQDETLNVTVTPNPEKDDSGILPLQTIYNNLGCDTYAWGFRAEADVIEIELHNVRHPSEDLTCGPIIDVVTLTILNPIKPTGGNLVKNGDFGEGPYVYHTTTGVLIPPNIEDDHSPLPSWMIESSKAIKYLDSNHFSVPEGQRAVELLGGQESSIAQIIRTKPKENYVLTFLVGDANNGCARTLSIEAFAGTKARTQVTLESKGKGGFTNGRLYFTAETDRTRIWFRSMFYTMTTQGSLCGPVLDDVKVLTTRYHKRIHA